MGSGERDAAPSDDDGVRGATGGDADGFGSSLDRSDVVTGAILSVTVVVAVAVLLAGPPGALAGSGGTDDGASAAGTPTATPTSTTTTSRSPALDMQVRSIESCGTRCRLVTIALSNRGDEAARSVRVATEITTDGSVVWTGEADVGRLAAGETVSRTRTVRVGYVDAASIEANGGRIRIETVVHTAEGTRVFTERRTVS
jgi:hypothetical protein